MPEFGAVQNVSVYEPPSCVENPRSCAQAKVVVVTDGQIIHPEVPGAPDMFLRRADSILAERRADSFVLLYVPSAFRRENETSDWPCARNAVLTPGPCINELGQCGLTSCNGVFGQADKFLRYVGSELLPWVAESFNGAGIGQRAGIIGFSYGGLTSAFAAWSRPDLFDAAGCGSPSMWYPTPQCIDNTSQPYLNGTYMTEVAMRQFPAPVNTRLYVSDGTTEGMCMGGTASAPGPIPLTVQNMRKAVMSDFPFEENTGYQHDIFNGWATGTMWRALESIIPYNVDKAAVSPVPHDALGATSAMLV